MADLVRYLTIGLTSIPQPGWIPGSQSIIWGQWNLENAMLHEEARETETMHASYTTRRGWSVGEKRVARRGKRTIERQTVSDQATAFASADFGLPHQRITAAAVRAVRAPPSAFLQLNPLLPCFISWLLDSCNGCRMLYPVSRICIC